MIRLIGTSALLVLLSTTAHAGDDALALYGQGQYDRSIAVASAENSAGGFALAARATLADAMMQKPCLACLKRAEGFARRAIAADSKPPEGHVYLAVALGYQARIVGIVRARLANYAEDAKSNLDAALASDPRNVWALAARGGWNIEIVRGGGAVLADWLYGASVTQGLADFAAAFKSAPDNIVLRYQYALSLGGFDPVAYRGEVEDALRRANSRTALTAYDGFAQNRARELLAALKKNDRAEFARLVRRDQGYP